jgi:hypothetical protein
VETHKIAEKHIDLKALHRNEVTNEKEQIKEDGFAAESVD